MQKRKTKKQRRSSVTVHDLTAPSISVLPLKSRFLHDLCPCLVKKDKPCLSEIVFLRGRDIPSPHAVLYCSFTFSFPEVSPSPPPENFLQLSKT